MQYNDIIFKYCITNNFKKLVAAVGKLILYIYIFFIIITIHILLLKHGVNNNLHI